MALATRETTRPTAPVTAEAGKPAAGGGRIPLILLCLLVAVLVLPSLYSVIVRSFTSTTPLGEPGAATLANYTDLFGQNELLTVVRNTLISTAGATAVALVIGGVLAWVVERTNAPGAALCRVVMLLSLAIPYILYSIAWIMLLGPDGPVNSAGRTLLGVGHLIDAHSLTAMILVEGLIGAPLAFLFLGAVLRTQDASLEESAAVSGASTFQVFRKVTGPLAMPAVVGVALLIFVRTLEAFEIPALIGLPGRVRVMTTSIFLDTQGFPPDYGMAGAYAIVLMLGVVVLLYLTHRVNRRAAAFAGIGGKLTRPRRADLGARRWLGTAAIAVYGVVALIAPVGIILWASLVPYYSAPSWSKLKLLTGSNYAHVLGLKSFLPSVEHTVIVGAVAAVAIMAISAVGIWLHLRVRVSGGWVFEQLAMMPLVIPGAILGFSLVAFYLNVPLPIYGTLTILMIGYAVRYMPYGVRYASAGMLQIHASLEEAADISGAPRWTTFRRVVLPLVRPSLVSGAVFVFLMASKELAMAVMLAAPGQETMSVEMYQLWTNGQTTQVATIGVLWVGVLLVVMGGLIWFNARRGRSLEI
ncbi:ABC transporter permease [Streptomyces sp. NPDC050560]|uniref:ABC transporter permease n=1 Tax=Streptomyces sp. NPDC050560 TaxID=3365630 RepID=UPI0037AE4A37